MPSTTQFPQIVNKNPHPFEEAEVGIWFSKERVLKFLTCSPNEFPIALHICHNIKCWAKGKELYTSKNRTFVSILGEPT
jgi:hypothetical protein